VPRRRQPAAPRDPWAKAPVGELDEPLLPRWFALLAVALVPLAVLVFLVAFLGVTRDAEPTPPAARRPPPADGLTHAVGRYEVGSSPPEAYEPACPEVDGVRVAGTDADQALLRRALAGVCRALPAGAPADAAQAFAAAGGIVRFAAFETTGVDSAAELANGAPRILVNARFVQSGQPRWISPLIVHDAVMLAGDAASAETALAARRVEAEVCRAVLGTEAPSRGCEDAEAVLALADPLTALRAAGYR
jgi:hypothetical protein